MNKISRTAVLALSLIVYGCGGGGGSGSGGGGVVVVPPPPPSPPPPPPPPPPTVVTAVGGFGMLAEFRFYPTGYNQNATDVAARSGDRQGRYPIQSGQALFTTFFGNLPTNYAAVDKQAFGIDAAAGMFGNYRAPADATVITPLTTLLVGANTEAKLESQLGIDGGVFGLATDRALKTFVPIDALTSSDSTTAADGERLLASHIRVMAVAAALQHMTGAPSDPSGVKIYDMNGLRAYLDGVGTQFIFTNANMSALLGTGGAFPRPTYRPDVISAAAHLVDAYAATIGIRIANRQQATRFTLGIWGYLVPTITRLLQANDAATASEILAVNNQQILDATARFSEQLPFDANDNFFPAPDFYSIARGGVYTVPAVDVGSNGDGPLNSNDIHIEPDTTSGNHFFPGASQVTAVTVPQANASEVSAVLNGDGTVTIRPAAAFTGVTYFDYTVRHSRGT